jgi:ferredoxin
MHLEHDERQDEPEIADLGVEVAGRNGGGGAAVGPDEPRVPVEPETPAAGAPAADAARSLQELLAFYLYGRRPAAAGDEGGDRIPALFHPYRDLSRIRHEYPVCLNGSDPAPAIRSLSECTDHVVSELAQPGDAGEQLRRHVYRLESIVRSLAADETGGRLATLWDRAAAMLMETSKLPAEKEKVLRENIAAARKALAADGDLVPCAPGAAERLVRASVGVFWRERCAAWKDELDTLTRRLQDVLAADFQASEAARSPRHLHESLGDPAAEVDVHAMSDLLASRPYESRLPDERRDRIQSVLGILTRMQPVFDPGAPVTARDSGPFRFDAFLDDCAAALEAHRLRLRLLTEFFRAVRIARLEIQNRYRGDIHDPFFSGFSESHLTDDELALCPPVLVRLTGADLARTGVGALLEVLNANAPVKILLELRSLQEGGTAPGAAIRVAGTTRWASMAMALHHAYVVQAPVSRVGVLRSRLLDGMRFPGPALFSIYSPDGDAALSAYLRAEAAAESRVLPVLVFDPSHGDTLAERVDLGDNTQSERPWPVDHFAYRRANGEEASADLAFTPADFFFCDRGLARHFWNVPVEKWHDNMMPVDEYLDASAQAAAGRIPYVWTVDGAGRLGRAAMTRAVVGAARQCRSFWRGVQESGGIDNSFAKRLLDAERERLAEEKEREVEAIEKNYLAQLDQDVGELTKEIVQRIAIQLTGMEGVDLGARATVPLAPAPGPPRATAAPEAAAAAATVEEEEEAVAFDDPYIDTPLCTSCNECTQLNARLFAYNANKQAEVKDASAGPFSDLVRAAELCPVHIIHPGKPKNPGEPGLEEWIQRAARFN